jgi:hypothetical protein
MGWSTGTELLGHIIKDIPKALPHRKEVFKILITNFEDFDADGLYELRGEDSDFDAALEELYPDE